MALGARQQVKNNLETGHLSRHYIAEISLNVTLNHNQPNQLVVQHHIQQYFSLVYRDGAVVQSPNLDLLLCTHAMGQLGVFYGPSLLPHV